MTITRDQALDYIHQHPETYLHKAKKKGYICPICGSGSGPNGTGLITKDNVHFTCAAGTCFKWADIPDIIAKKEGLEPGSKEALQAAYNAYGITIAGNPLPTGEKSITIAGIKIKTGQDKQQPPAKPQEKPQQDFTAYYEDCHKRIKETTYPIQRGLTGVSIDRFKVGYDPNFRTKEVLEDGTEQYTTWKALIIPNGPYNYTVRNMKPGATDRVRERGAKIPFNLPAMDQTEKPVFIVEGEIDALSIVEAGGEAVALRGTAADKLLSELDKKRPAWPLLLSLDKDEAGRAAESKLMEALTARKIPFLQADIAGDYKDANEALTNNTAAFVQAVYMAQQSIIKEQEEAEKAAEAERQERTGPGMVDHFLQAIQTRRYEPMPTGIADFDRAIGGGFIRQQIVLLGAPPGAGKTALAQWIFEGMAKRGTSCVFLNLEMAQEQVLARSISRIVAQQGGAIKTTDILQGYKWTEQQRQQITAAAATYRAEIAPRMIYNPPGVTANLDSILEYIEQEAQRAKAAGEQAPVCVLDYLQIVGGKDREEPAAIIKRAVEKLKAYARDHNTLVFVIIAHNRESNKTGSATMEAGRDTSALEYSADLQMALNYTLCMERDGQQKRSPNNLTDEEKKQVTLKITKGRFGGAGKEVDLIFNGETMTYTQVTKDFDKPRPLNKRL